MELCKGQGQANTVGGKVSRTAAPSSHAPQRSAVFPVLPSTEENPDLGLCPSTSHCSQLMLVLSPLRLVLINKYTCILSDSITLSVLLFNPCQLVSEFFTSLLVGNLPSEKKKGNSTEPQLRKVCLNEWVSSYSRERPETPYESWHIPIYLLICLQINLFLWSAILTYIKYHLHVSFLVLFCFD